MIIYIQIFNEVAYLSSINRKKMVPFSGKIKIIFPFREKMFVYISLNTALRLSPSRT